MISILIKSFESLTNLSDCNKYIMIKKANPQLIFAIKGVFRACVAHMESLGIMQWHEDYPAIENVRLDIERGELYYIGEGEEVWATITLNEEQESQYQDIKWNCTEGKILVVHRLATHPGKQGRGLARQLMGFAEEYARSNDYAAIRLDSYEANPRSQRFYSKMGYVKTGYVQFDYQEFRCTAFEKIMS